MQVDILRSFTSTVHNEDLPRGLTIGSLCKLLLETLRVEEEPSRYYDKNGMVIKNRVLVDYWNILEGQGWRWNNNKRVPPGQTTSDYYDDTDGVNRFIKMIVDQINQNDNLVGMPQEAKCSFESIRLKCKKVLSSLQEATAEPPSRRRTRGKQNYKNPQRPNA
jgi:hypothetical protein